MHNLQLTDDQQMIVDTVRKFVQDVVAPAAQERDEHRQFARDELTGLGELGLFGLPVPEAQGGVGLGLLPLAAACEELGLHSGSLARLLAVQVQCALALGRAGASQRDGVIAGSAAAAWIGGEHAVAAAGSELTGTAELVAGAADADLLVVAANDGDAPVLAVVERGAAAVTPLRSLGLASAGPARVVFAATRATIVARGDVALAARHAADVCAWIGSAATCVGLGRAAVQLAQKHARERIAFGKPLLAQQAVARKLTEGQRAVDAARHLVFHAARVHDLGQDAEAEALTARIAAVDAAVQAADEAIQIHGGYGYTVEYHVERHYRDAKTIEVLDGGNERCRDRLTALHFSR